MRKGGQWPPWIGCNLVDFNKKINFLSTVGVLFISPCFLCWIWVFARTILDVCFAMKRLWLVTANSVSCFVLGQLFLGFCFCSGSVLPARAFGLGKSSSFFLPCTFPLSCHPRIGFSHRQISFAGLLAPCRLWVSHPSLPRVLTGSGPLFFFTASWFLSLCSAHQRFFGVVFVLG
jgi:hypothetical protein